MPQLRNKKKEEKRGFKRRCAYSEIVGAKQLKHTVVKAPGAKRRETLSVLGYYVLVGLRECTSIGRFALVYYRIYIHAFTSLPKHSLCTSAMRQFYSIINTSDKILKRFSTCERDRTETWDTLESSPQIHAR